MTLAKPDFDEHSKKKAAASPSIALVRHDVFMEGLMGVLTGRLSAGDFVAWLAEPGVTDLNRLPGTPTLRSQSDVANKIACSVIQVLGESYPRTPSTSSNH